MCGLRGADEMRAGMRRGMVGETVVKESAKWSAREEMGGAK